MVKKQGQKDLYFMLSNWYSGATLLAILLNNHKEISCNGESPPFRNNEIKELVCSCGSKLDTCTHYQSVGKFLFNSDSNTWDRDLFQTVPNICKLNFINKCLSQFSYFPRIRDLIIKKFPLFTRRINYFLDAQQQLIKNTNNHDHSSIYIDGTKSVRRAEMFLNRSNKSKIIYLIRDGRAFCHSYTKNEPKANNTTLKIAAKSWNGYIKLVDKLMERYPDTEILYVKYEDLCNKSENTIRKVCDFLNISYEPNIFNFENRQYHILGNLMKNKFNGVIKEDLSWKRTLDAEGIKAVTKIMHKNLKRFGYI